MRLGVEIVALGCDEAPLDGIEVQAGRWTVSVGFVCGSASSGLMHNVDGVAFPEKVLRPAVASVRRAGEVGSGLSAAVDHDDGPRVSLLGGNLEFGIKLSAHRLPVGARGVFSAGEQ